MTPDQIMAALETERKRRGWPKERLANEAGMVLRTYRKWLNGERSPKVVSLMPYCDVLGLELVLKRKDKE